MIDILFWTNHTIWAFHVLNAMVPRVDRAPHGSNVMRWLAGIAAPLARNLRVAIDTLNPITSGMSVLKPASAAAEGAPQKNCGRRRYLGVEAPILLSFHRRVAGPRMDFNRVHIVLLLPTINMP